MFRIEKRNGRLDFVSLEKENIDIEDDEPELDNIPISEIHNMIRELKPGYRTIFNLYVFEEKTFASQLLREPSPRYVNLSMDENIFKNAS